MSTYVSASRPMSIAVEGRVALEVSGAKKYGFWRFFVSWIESVGGPNG